MAGTHEFDELYELHDLIEHGPCWYALDRIEIRLVDQTDPMTVEESMQL